MSTEELLELTRAALEVAETQSGSVSEVARRSYRIAWIRGDLEAAYWIAYELYSVGSTQTHGPIKRDILRNLFREEAQALHERTLDCYIELREMTVLDEEGSPLTERKVASASLVEIEVHTALLTRKADELAYDQDTLAFGSSIDLERTLRRGLRWAAAENSKVLGRVLTRLHQFLVATEADLVAGQGHVGLVQRNHDYVEEQLKERVPEALAQLRNASELAQKEDSESWSLAGTSCRRALKSVADVIYPPSGTPVVGTDGRARSVTDDKWKNRIWHFIAERVSTDGARATLENDLRVLGASVDALNVVASKGVHASLSSSEANICVTRSYLLIGDLLRLEAGASGLNAVDTDAPDESIVSRQADLTEDGYST